jgi:lipoate-protein ligase A
VSRTNWNDYDWQLIHDGPRDPALHVALDQILTEEVAAGRRSPILRFWEWEAGCVVIGRFQSLANEVDPEGAKRHGIHVVRRISGGGAMFMEAGNCITYSIHAPESLVKGMSFQESYAFFDQWVIDALGDLGIESWYEPLNDIASPGGKIGGAAQLRRKHGVLHHVTMAYDMNAAKMLEVLRIGKEKLSDKGKTSAAKRVGPIRTQTGLAREAIIARMTETFRRNHGLAETALRPEELAAANTLMREKIDTDAWRAIVP